MDRNPMLQNGHSPVPVLGAIPGKAFLDYGVVDVRRENANDPVTAITSYPGGNQDINHDAMPMDTAFGLRSGPTCDIIDGEPNEAAFVSVAGLNWNEFCSQRQMEDSIYWIGIVTTEERVTNPLDGPTGDPSHGFATIRAGTHSVINNSMKTIYAGNLVCWRIPRAPFHPKADGVTKFNNGSLINPTARYGTPPTQFRPEYVPFDHTDYTAQMSAAFASITSTKDQEGVADMGFVNALPNIHGWRSERPWTGIQDEAISYKYAFAGIGLAFANCMIRNGLLEPTEKLEQLNAEAPLKAETLVDDATAHAATSKLSQALGLWSTLLENQEVLHEFIADVMLKNINAGDARREAAVARFEAGANQSFRSVALAEPDARDFAGHYNRLRINLCEILIQGITGSWYSAISKIVGKSMSNSAPADTLDVLWGHFCI